MIYKVLSNIKVGDRTYVAGEEVELPDDDETKTLIIDGVVGEWKVAEPKKPKKAAKLKESTKTKDKRK